MNRAQACLRVLLPVVALASNALIAQAVENRPNIVLLISDDHDYEHYGFVGNPVARTPNLDSLAERGVVFTTGHLPSSLCRPTLATLLSGRLPHQTGIYANDFRNSNLAGGAVRLDPANSLPRLLRDSGYRTFVAGKYWEGDVREMGFTDGSAEPSFTAYLRLVREDQDGVFQFIEDVAGKQPFFVWWAPMLPHEPHVPPERHRVRFENASIPVPRFIPARKRAIYRHRERRQLAMVSWLDEGVGDLVEKLKASGVYEDTLFVFLADNGWAVGRPSKGSVFEKGLRTAMLFTWSSRLEGGQRFDRIVRTMDIYPTILSAAGVEVPRGTVGRSLLPAMLGKGGLGKTVSIGAIYPRSARVDSPSPETEIQAFFLRDGRWKFVYYLDFVGRKRSGHIVHGLSRFPDRRPGTADLFDLEADPYELVDLSQKTENRARVARYQADVLDWWEETGGRPIPRHQKRKNVQRAPIDSSDATDVHSPGREPR